MSNICHWTWIYLILTWYQWNVMSEENYNRNRRTSSSSAGNAIRTRQPLVRFTGKQDPDVSRLWLPSFAKLPVSLWRHRGSPPHRWRRLVIPAPDPHQNFRTFVNVSVCLRLPKTNAYRWFVLPDASIAWATSLRHRQTKCGFKLLTEGDKQSRG